MNTLILIALLQYLYVEQSIQTPTALPKVSIYYECLCPYSTDFITKQFYPAYQKIGGYLQINFVPYGIASQINVDDEWAFECDHGAKECWGNKAQACGLAEDREQNLKVEFVNCMMGHKYPASEKALTKCSPKLNVTKNSILDCIQSKKGDDLFAKLGDETNNLRPRIPGVPFVIFNNRYNEEIDAEASDNFLEVACRYLPSRPGGCPQQNIKLEGKGEEVKN